VNHTSETVIRKN